LYTEDISCILGRLCIWDWYMTILRAGKFLTFRVLGMGTVTYADNSGFGRISMVMRVHAG
jgi:hypothetical protein